MKRGRDKFVRYARPREYRFNPRQPLEQLDPVVARFAASRFTFTEPEALNEIWAAGEDIRLREDVRFYELEELGHFHLSQHILANHTLIERLWQGIWDGRDINAELTRLDQTKPDSFHVYCPADPRFTEIEGRLTLTARPAVRLPDELRKVLDGLAAQLLATHRANGTPATTLQLRDELLRLNASLDFDEQDVDWLEAWLLGRSEWAEIARGLWLPTDLLPRPDIPQVFRVIRVGGSNQQPGTESFIRIEQSDETEQAEPNCPVPAAPPVESHPDASVSWTHTLRAIHLNNGYIPVPSSARFRYPQVMGINRCVVIRCVAHDSGREGWLWLDREQHRLFGDLLKEIIEWEEAGRKLNIQWKPEAIVIRLGGLDAEVQAEETRHIDPEALHELRLGRGESYRQALVAILRDQAQGLAFRPLYEALALRQQHQPNRASVRIILSQSSDFCFINGVWRWQESVNPAKNLRKLMMMGTTDFQLHENSISLGEKAGLICSKVKSILTHWS
jgi:hypothetical protein